MRKIKIGWLDNFDGYYQVDEEIRNQCNKTLSALAQNIAVVEEVKPTANPHYLSNSWKTLRSKSLYDELVNYNLNADEKIHSINWEIRNGQLIKEEDIDEALLWRSLWNKDINSIFKKYDYLALPSTQVHPFNKDIPSPTAINGELMGTYHQWMDIVVLASILGLPTISVPVSFNREGLPVGMQLIGKRKSDTNLVAFAKKYETIFNFSEIIPKDFS